MKAIKFILIILLVTTFIFTTNTTAQIPFTEHFIGDASGVAGLFNIDLDKDGDMDIISGSANDGISWWRNDGGNPVNWTEFIVDGAFIGCFSVVSIDIENDGDLDILGTGWNLSEIALWKNEGGEPFTWSKQILDNNFVSAHEVFTCDFDDDGDADVFGAAANDEMSWWRNDGGDPIIWTKQVISDNFSGARSIYAIDLDGDGDKDIAGAALISDEVAWWQNNGGDPINWTKFRIAGNFSGSHRVQCVDFDMDGDNDILGAAFTSNEISWWSNEGGDPVNWTKQIITNTFNGAVIGVAADIDNDGDNDVLGTAQPFSDVAWWENKGGDPYVWEKHNVDDTFAGAWPALICDIDGDEDNDLVAGGNAANEIVYWENGLYQTHFKGSPQTGHAPVNVQFTDMSSSKFAITGWQWDFNNDGVTDSQIQNPAWTFDNPGIYTISLDVITDSTVTNMTYQDYIHVFDGASSLSFDGINSYVKIDADTVLNFTESFTIEGYIYPKGWGENPSLGFGRIFDKSVISLFLIDTSPVFNDHSLALQMSHESGAFSFSMSDPNSINLNEWQHVAVNYDASKNLVKIYINGIEQTISHTSPPSGPVKNNIVNDLLIGNNNGYNFTFDGLIDDLRFWNYCRTEEEINAKMDSYLYGSENGLIGYWNMDEAVGDEILDGTENSNNGSLFGASWYQGKNLNPATSVTDIPDHNNINFILRSNYPNPFNPSTKISFDLLEKCDVELNIYNLQGQQIKQLFNGQKQAGSHFYFWNGTNSQGQRVASGLYIYQLRAGKLSFSKKMVFTK